MTIPRSFTSHFPLPDLLEAVFSMTADDVAYLALTGNSEGALRDRIALHLRSTPRVLESGWVVARELRPRRVDLAILDENGRPIAAFELKAGYSYDVLDARKWTELSFKLKLDLDKCRTLLDAYESLREAYLLVFIAHPLADIPERFEVVAGKYGRHIKRLREKCGATAGDVGDEMLARFRETFPGVQRLDDGALRGTAFSVPVMGFWYGIEAGRAVTVGPG